MKEKPPERIYLTWDEYAWDGSKKDWGNYVQCKEWQNINSEEYIRADILDVIQKRAVRWIIQTLPKKDATAKSRLSGKHIRAFYERWKDDHIYDKPDWWMEQLWLAIKKDLGEDEEKENTAFNSKEEMV